VTEPVKWTVGVGSEAVSAVYEPATSATQHAVFAMAHGAGGNMSDRAMLAAANMLRAHGFGVCRFNFLYKEKGSGRPDPMPRCMEVISAVVDRIRTELDPKVLIIGGRSMGGRAASILAAEKFPAQGLLLLAYPLHPEGKPEKLRDEHLGNITMPVLCFNGTRDGLCTPEIMERILRTKVGSWWTMHWLDGADHSFHVLKSSGRDDKAVLEEMGEAAVRWLIALSSRA
jgi:predicted alpha/beta-hydrolase family hydrolase